MRVIDGAKARVLAVAMTAVATIQLWPAAAADPDPKTTTASSAGTKEQKKSKKKRASTHHGLGSWHVMRGLGVSNAEVTEDLDPIEIVLKTARKQLGDPYRWGAVGPDSFDCSGFTMYVWRKAGVELPHNSGAQRGATKHVPLDDMKPGDLIFSSGHVGLYIGKGKMIHSPHSGRNVEIAPIHSRAYGAGRPKV